MPHPRETRSEKAGSIPPARIGREEFGERLAGSYRLFWLSAVGIIGNASKAEDVVQEAAVIALGKLDTFEAGSNFEAWMGSIVRFVAMNQYRKERGRRTEAVDPVTIDQHSEASASPERHRDLGKLVRGDVLAAHLDLDDQTLRALQQVDEVARACLLLRTLEDLPYAKISALLGVPEGTAMSHVHRARKFLRERLSQRGGPAGSRAEGSV
jgi:RNA polymerase sigma-70 factor (ECF subfamily)